MNLRTQPSKRIFQNIVISLGIFLLALLPRAYDLDRFVTADEAKWVYRSAQFLNAFLRGDFAATNVNLTPAVTTTWLGGIGLTIYHQTHPVITKLPFSGWLNSLPEFRAELPVLVAARLPLLIFASIAVVAIYWLVRRLLGAPVAFVAAVLIALDPHTIALSRILGHDAPAAIFMSLSLLLLLLALQLQAAQKPNRRYIFGLVASSGIMAGLAFLSKAPALFLIPFAGLMFVGAGVNARRSVIVSLGKWFLLWGVAAYLTFLVVWPAAWSNPVGQPLAVVENAFLSATDQDEADLERYWLVPNLGPLYYVVHGTFKLGPLVLVGAGLTLVFLVWPKYKGKLSWYNRPSSTASILWLLAYVLLFTVFMTFGSKRSARYILPIFPPLAIVAAFGWQRLCQVVSGKWRSAAGAKINYISRLAFYTVFTLAAALVLLPYTPYYFSYFNPLLGGAYTAPSLVKIGWGEGLDQAGRFLQRELRGSRVGTAYASTVSPYFDGDISAVTGSNLDYLILYSKQVQSGRPSPAFIGYFKQETPMFSVNLNGIHYADVYRGPALQSSFVAENSDGIQPVGFRPLTPYGRIGEMLEVDVVWQAGVSLPPEPVAVTLQPVSALTPGDDAHTALLAKGNGQVTRLADGLTVSRHQLMLPANLARGDYALLVNNQPLGKVELRHFRQPENLGAVTGIVFDEQVEIAGYQFNPTEDYLEVVLAWQARQAQLPNYTVFAQLLDVDTNQRVAGFDTQPVRGEWPTSRWVKDEVVTDTYLIAIPPDLSPGHYKVIVGLYQPETGRRLLLQNGQDHWLIPWTFIWKQ